MNNIFRGVPPECVDFIGRNPSKKGISNRGCHYFALSYGKLKLKQNEAKGKKSRACPCQSKRNLIATPKDAISKNCLVAREGKSKEIVDSQTKVRQPNWQIGQATGSKDKEGISRKKRSLNKINKKIKIEQKWHPNAKIHIISCLGAIVVCYFESKATKESIVLTECGDFPGL